MGNKRKAKEIKNDAAQSEGSREEKEEQEQQKFSTMDDKWVIKELHGTRKAPKHCHSLTWPGGTLLAPAVTSSALHGPWSPSRAAGMHADGLAPKTAETRFFLFWLLLSPQAGQRDVVAPCSWLEFPPKSGFLLGEGPAQSQDCCIHVPEGHSRQGRSLAASSLCLLPGPSTSQRDADTRAQHPQPAACIPMTLAVPRSHLTCSHRLCHAHSITSLICRAQGSSRTLRGVRARGSVPAQPRGSGKRRRRRRGWLAAGC